MKTKFQKETALKGLLLMVLLANVSWRPAMQSMNLIEQSSTGETMGGAGTTPAQPAGGSTSEPALPEEGEQVPVSSKGSTRATGEGQTRKALINVCGVYAYVQFREINVDSTTFTAINIRPHSGGTFRTIDRKVPGNFRDNLDVPQKKARIDNDNLVAIKNQISSRCAFQIQNEVARVADATSAQSEDDVKRIKKGQAECRLDSKGDPLTELARLKCELTRLSNVDVNTDRRGSELRAMNEIEKIVKEIRPHLMKRLMSSDDSLFDEGKGYLEETVETLKTLATDLMLNPARVTKVITSLQSLEYGGESYRRSLELDEKVKNIKEEARQEMLDVEGRIAANPRDPTALNDRVMLRAKLSNTYRTLMSEATTYVNPSYTQLFNAQRSSLVSSAEFAQFASPYQVLARDLNTLSNPQFLLNDGPGGAFNPSIGAIGASYGQPYATDFNAYRNSLAGNRNKPISPALIGPENPFASLTADYSARLDNSAAFGPDALNGFNADQRRSYIAAPPVNGRLGNRAMNPAAVGAVRR